GRTVMTENSAATNKALTKTSRRTARIRNTESNVGSSAAGAGGWSAVAPIYTFYQVYQSYVRAVKERQPQTTSWYGGRVHHASLANPTAHRLRARSREVVSGRGSRA